MALDARTYLADIMAAANRITAFTSGKSYEEYLVDELMRSAVERQFEIVGEALRKLSESHPEVAANIPEYRRDIAFRNVLVHGYASVDNWLVWGIVEHKLPGLRAAVSALVASMPET